MIKYSIQNLIDAMTENVAIVDEFGVITHVNTKWYKFSLENSGPNKDAYIGSNYFSAISKAANAGDEHAKKIETGIQDVIAKNITSFELEYPCHSENEQRWFIANISEIESNTPRLFLFTHKNVSSLVIREQKVLEAQRLEAVGQLSSGIAHDFNNLLSIVLGNIEIAKLKVDESNLVHKNLDNSVSAIQKGAALIQKLLSFSRKQHLELETIDENSFIQNIISFIKPALGELIEIDTHCTEIPLPIKVDANMLSNAILNIAVNAHHAMPEGGKLTLSTFYTELHHEKLLTSEEDVSGKFAVIAIADTGSGIKDKDFNKIFEPFFTTKEVGEGSGLGLSMVFGFMKQSGGHIHVKSMLGKGTTFYLYLPVIANKISIKETESTTPLLENTHNTILLVEDNSGTRDTIKQLLEGIGFTVIESSSGQDALDTLKQNADEINILFADVVIPSDIDGIELAKETHKTYPKIKILLMSGYPNKTFPDSIPGAFPVILSKPFSLNTLINALNQL